MDTGVKTTKSLADIGKALSMNALVK